MQPSSVPPEPLLPRIARGDAGAVEECMQRYAPLVWTLARRMTRDASTVEELVQEVFVEVWRSAARYDPAIASESTYIATIARRRIIDRQRRAARLPTTEIPDEHLPDEAAGSQVDAVDQQDEAQRATQALAKLQPEQRRLILMSVVEGLTHQEIAAATGLPLGTVKSHIRRGLDQTARILGAPRAEERS